MSFVTNSRKTWKCWNQNFFAGGWNRLCQTLILTVLTRSKKNPLNYYPPCFLPKIAQIVQKVICIFPEKGRGDVEPWFWHIGIAQQLTTFFLATTYCFRFWPPSGGTGGQNGWSNFGSVPFPYKLESFTKFPNNVSVG